MADWKGKETLGFTSTETRECNIIRNVSVVVAMRGRVADDGGGVVVVVV